LACTSTPPTGGNPVYVGGQNGLDATGALAGGAQKQTEQALRNVLTVLAEAGAAQADVAKMTVHLVESVDPREAFGAVAGVWGRTRPRSPCSAWPAVLHGMPPSGNVVRKYKRTRVIRLAMELACGACPHRMPTVSSSW
jgi:enamine deaminase RidA (YjgF/YER057c/UK114 family)